MLNPGSGHAAGGLLVDGDTLCSAMSPIHSVLLDLDGTLSAPGRLQAGPGPVISCGCDRADQQHHGQINLPASSRKIGMARAGESTPDSVGNANRNVNDDVSSATRPATGTTA